MQRRSYATSHRGTGGRAQWPDARGLHCIRLLQIHTLETDNTFPHNMSSAVERCNRQWHQGDLAANTVADMSSNTVCYDKVAPDPMSSPEAGIDIR